MVACLLCNYLLCAFIVLYVFTFFYVLYFLCVVIKTSLQKTARSQWPSQFLYCSAFEGLCELLQQMSGCILEMKPG